MAHDHSTRQTFLPLLVSRVAQRAHELEHGVKRAGGDVGVIGSGGVAPCEIDARVLEVGEKDVDITVKRGNGLG